MHLNIQIPQRVTYSEYLIMTLLFKHTSSDIYARQIYLILWSFLCYSTCPTALGPKIMVPSRVRRKFVLMVIVPSRSPEQLLVCWIYCKKKTTKKCLVNFAFSHQETKYFRWKHCAKMICESSVPNRVGTGTTLLQTTNVTGPLYHRCWIGAPEDKSPLWLDALNRAGPNLSLPHNDDEHADSTCTLLLCAIVKGEEEVASFKELKNFTNPPFNAQE